MANEALIPTLEQLWRRYDADEHRLSAPLSERMLELAGLRPGQHVLDLATGRGEPAIRAALRVAPAGTVLGVDLSEPMLGMARERAVREGAANLELRAGNIETLEGVPRGRFDAVLARWCLMYLEDPVAALRSARDALRPGGVLVAALWAEPERVSYYSLPRRVLEPYRRLPPIEPETPGIFRYADSAALERDLARAGLRIEQSEEMEVAVMEARTDADLIAWCRAFGLARLVDDLPAPTQRAWEAALVRAAEPLRCDGVVRLGGTTRIVLASRP